MHSIYIYINSLINLSSSIYKKIYCFMVNYEQICKINDIISYY